ncbi:MAG: biosynthetic arginine decarboxylase [Acidobacteriota bacterium]|nr:biosynthetic arginine decarboxylase [Acidobacteriota bacterium]
MSKWNIDDALEIYKIPNWGLGYFSVNEKGNLCVKPSDQADHQVDLRVLVDELRQRNIKPPILIRFLDILRDRIARISSCFHQAIINNEYQGRYYPLFPIKTNQERDVVTSILNYGKEHGLGLEAGSKAELLIVLALTTDLETPIICNGYKDREFVELVGMAHRMGKNIIPVIENFGELETFAAHYRNTGIMPDLGIRIKLSTRGIGKWAKTGGDSSKFGLRIPEVMAAVRLLEKENLLDSLKLIHFHIGSQVTKIGVVKQAIVETMRVYVELCRMGAPMGFVDIGGGLGVDYDGTQGDSHGTINYSIEEYASDIIYRIKQACDEGGIQHPTVFSESGRFLSAHYSMLVTNIAATSALLGDNPEIKPPEKSFGPVKEMYEILEILDESNMVESYHDALQYKTESLNLFSLGYMSLSERAIMEELFWTIMRELYVMSRNSKLSSQELDNLEHEMADTYFANFSIFQSLPDAWAIDQVFPLIPIHRLDEEPDRKGVVVDLTCDSDGLIGAYVGDEERNPSVPLHRVISQEPYYIGIFLVGAYQETLGELHNLFGDTHAVQIQITGEGRYRVLGVIKGDTIYNVIDYMSYDTKELLHQMREQIEGAVERGTLTVGDSAAMMQRYENSLYGYTYFNDGK